MPSLLFLLLLAALGWFWLNSMRALEIARNAGKQVCGKASVQFLDDTVSSIGLALVRDLSGRRVLRRTYRFEFSETGDSRLEGRVIVLGNRVESVTMEPYQMLSREDASCELLHAPSPCDDNNTFSGPGETYGGSCCGCGGRNGIGKPVSTTPYRGEAS